MPLRENKLRQEEYLRRYTEFKKLGHPFWPDVILEDVLASLVVLIGLLFLAVFVGVPLDARADPTNAAYIPRPEWYFMWMFELLKFFPGELEWVGVIAVPAIGILFLLLVPFYDRHPHRRPRRRPVGLSLGSGVLAGAILLTFFAFSSTPSPAATVGTPGGEVRLTAAQLQGRQLYNANCAVCHTLGGSGGTTAPPLDGVVSRMDPAFIHIYIEDPEKINPGTVMPAFLKYPDVKTLTHQQTDMIVEYLKAFP